VEEGRGEEKMEKNGGRATSIRIHTRSTPQIPPFLERQIQDTMAVC
jgi:hypothetical protein